LVAAEATDAGEECPRFRVSAVYDREVTCDM